MSCSGNTNCACGCCAGISVQTPVLRDNLPGLSAVTYRAGTWASFKESMLARLSSSDYPALAALRTREDDDFSIALIDSAAVMLDILTFYQERLVNESYLGTAGQIRSLYELSRLIGYSPAPGVSASAYVAFTLRTAPGQSPTLSTPAVTISAGTQMQSVPTQGQVPQTFETSADIQAKSDWNALPVQTGQPWIPPNSPNGNASTSLYLCGITTQLQPGDALLFLGVDRQNWTPAESAGPNEAWDIVILTQVVPDPVRKLTCVSWDAPIAHEKGAASTQSANATVFALRQKASLFGHNAPNPNLFVNVTNGNPLFPALITVTPNSNPAVFTWNHYQIPAATQIDLDSAYAKIATGSWFALVDSVVGTTTGSRYAQVFCVADAHATTASGFTLSAKVTELVPDFADPNIVTAPATPSGYFNLPSTEVLAQSEMLPVAPQPLPYPLYGTLLDLQDLRPDLTSLQAVAVFGKRQKIAVVPGITTLNFIPDAGTGSEALAPGAVLSITTPPPVNADGSFPDWTSASTQMTLSVQDANGRTGVVTATLNQFVFVPSGTADPDVSEFALVASILPLTTPYPHTRLQLTAPLSFCYDRSVTTVNANVALATNGRAVSEFLGSGQASNPNQNFVLKQPPLTYVPALSPTGRQSSLQVVVNGVTWTEVASLSGQSPSAQVFATVNRPDGTAKVQFGDGVEGALLPTGQNNLLARYRNGLGSAGNVPANSLSTLVDRPLGVSGVTNPSAATGGQDPQPVADIRANAPLSVLTLGRAVSLTDYENFATTFAGIAKAQAVWIPAGPARGIFLTVAGVGGVALPPGSPTLTNLVASLINFGNPLIPITAQSFYRGLFGLSADLAYDPAYVQAAVTAQVLATLSTTYSFAQRSFGQSVTADELATVIQAVPGVVAVNVKEIHTSTRSVSTRLSLGSASSDLTSSGARTLTRGLQQGRRDFSMIITPHQPTLRTNVLPKPAEILLLDPSPNAVVLGVMA
jgi:hypothetical protein